MRVGLIGFGRAGKAVANIVLQNKKYRLEWVLRRSVLLDHRSVPEFLGIESDEPGLIYSSSKITVQELIDKHPVDYIIDFSSQSGIYTYGKIAAERKVNIISAISHYDESEIALLKELSKETVVFWSPNITLGVNFLIFASKFLQNIAPWADIEIIEQHFNGKKEVSGTARKIAEALDLDQSVINSIRVGGIVGKHEVIFGFPYQTVRIVHESIARESFGNGVLFALENLLEKKTGLYNFEDILTPYFNNLTPKDDS